MEAVHVLPVRIQVEVPEVAQVAEVAVLHVVQAAAEAEDNIPTLNLFLKIKIKIIKKH